MKAKQHQLKRRRLQTNSQSMQSQEDQANKLNNRVEVVTENSNANDESNNELELEQSVSNVDVVANSQEKCNNKQVDDEEKLKIIDLEKEKILNESHATEEPQSNLITNENNTKLVVTEETNCPTKVVVSQENKPSSGVNEQQQHSPLKTEFIQTVKLNNIELEKESIQITSKHQYKGAYYSSGN